MDKACGIVVEYNPFHNGHLYHLQKSKEITGANTVIAVMSGNFVQRGEPAVIDKFMRIKSALINGADMVLELPLPYATASAEIFAKAACGVLSATNITDSICFGSETGEIEPLYIIAKHLSNEESSFQRILRRELTKGLSFPAARAAAVSATLDKTHPGISCAISTPNNILAVEYLKSIIKEKLPLTPFTFKRHGGEHNSVSFSSGYASATAIRKHLHEGKDINELMPFMPKESFEIMKNEAAAGAINYIDKFSHFFHFALQNTNLSKLADICGLSVDMQNRLIAAARNNFTVSDVIRAAKTKNHTHAAFRRAVLSVILGVNRSFIYSPIPYIRVVGLRKERKELLNCLHKNASLPVVTNLKYAHKLPQNAKIMLDLELAATKIYWLGLKSDGVPERNELSVPLIMV